MLPKGSHILVVEKERHRLTIYDEHLRAVKSYRVTTGKVKGDKEREGDLKTPEGIYFFTRYIDGRRLHSRYGVGALVMDYPNPFDRLKGKGGYGIWLHATDEPQRLERPRDTRGCVVTTNEDFLDIKRTIKIRLTPIVVLKAGVPRQATGLYRELERKGIFKVPPTMLVARAGQVVALYGAERLYVVKDGDRWHLLAKEQVAQ